MCKAGGSESIPRPVRVLIVDDHPVVRDGLAALLTQAPDFELCGQAEDVADAIAQVEATRPEVAIIDLVLKTGSGLDLIKRLHAHHPEVRLLVWSMYPEDLYAERALRAGAVGYVHKGTATRQIIEGLRAVVAGHVFFSVDVSDKLLSRLVNAKLSSVSPIETLSDREIEAFRLMGHGLTTPQIAEHMHVSPKTVDTYRARIKEKLNLTHVSELVQRATQWVLESRQ